MSDIDAISQSPVLPSGEVITAKNTLQSFAAPDIAVAFANPVADLPSAEAQLFHVTSADAVPRRPDPPDAQQNDVPEPLRSSRSIDQNTASMRNGSKKRFICISVCLLLTLAIGGGIGGYCASSGACGKDDDDGNDGAMISSVSDNITTFINSITLSGRDISLAGTSPEDLALQWVVDEHAARENFSLNADQSRLLQRYALSTLLFQGNRPQYYGLNFENATIHWLNAGDVCVWSGIVCNHEGNIIEIQLPSFAGEIGSIPSDLGLLVSLKALHFGEQNFAGSLPNDIARLTEMEHLHLSSNNHGPTIPEWIGSLTSLTHLNLGANQLNGTIPEVLGLLTALETVYLKDNSLIGSIQSSFEGWNSMKYFGFSRNKLTGTLPSFIGRWTNVTYFTVSLNQMHGTIPESIANWSNVDKMYFYDNSFNGTVPVGICAHADVFTNLTVDCDVSCGCCTNCFNLSVIVYD